MTISRWCLPCGALSSGGKFNPDGSNPAAADVRAHCGFGNKVPKGHLRQQFEGLWKRYLPGRGVHEPLQRYNTDEMGTLRFKPLQKNPM